jgi:quinol-cytochrome oxidoreductase complex cytochrome b subunit
MWRNGSVFDLGSKGCEFKSRHPEKMKLFFRFLLIDNILMLTINRHLISYPTAINISYFWGFGSLAGLFLVIQIITGILLAMHHAPNSLIAFQSVEHIMRDLNFGWLLRYLHANGASFFFITLYIHIARGIFYRSYINSPFLWHTGILIFILTMATASMGYILPWGQMSFWGATVITNIFSALPKVGKRIVEWLWGGFSVENPTLNRFFSLHYLLPFLIAGIALLHLIVLHMKGSNNPLGFKVINKKIPFYPYFVLKDAQGLVLILLSYLFITFFNPNMLGHPDNYIFANCLVTPAHIVPEWYLLPSYAILRACPHKLGGIIGMGLAIIILFVFPFLDRPRFYWSTVTLFWQIYTTLFFIVVLLLGWLGSQPAHSAYTYISKIMCLLYFGLIIALPLINYLIIWTTNNNKVKSIGNCF